MARDEWEQLKSQAAMQLNQVPDEGGGAAPGGDLEVKPEGSGGRGGQCLQALREAGQGRA